MPWIGDVDFEAVIDHPVPFELDSRPKLARGEVWNDDAAALGL